MQDDTNKQSNGRHYHVIVGMSGYLPNHNDVCRTKRDALANARWHAEQYRDSGERVIGSAEHGYAARQSEALSGVFWDSIYVTGPCYDDCQSYDD